MSDQTNVIGIHDKFNDVIYLATIPAEQGTGSFLDILRAKNCTNAELQASFDKNGEEYFEVEFRGTMGHPDVAKSVAQNMIDAFAQLNETKGHATVAKFL